VALFIVQLALLSLPPHEPQSFTFFKEGSALQVLVRDNNVDQALRVLKKKLQRDGFFRDLKRKKFYEKPSERRTRERSEAVRRARKSARKLAQREGLLPPTKRRAVAGSRRDAPPSGA